MAITAEMSSDENERQSHSRPRSELSVGGRLDLAPLQRLLERISATYHPEQVWLFGSRARGDARPDSDWDLLVVIADDASEELLDPRLAWRVQRGSGVSADVIPCRSTEFKDASGTVNTLSFVVANEGVLL